MTHSFDSRRPWDDFAMAIVPFTPEQLYAACQDVYADGEHMPHQAWIDTLGDDVVLIRVSFPEEFCGRCAARLETLRILLHAQYGYTSDITFLIYGTDLEELGIKSRSEGLQRTFLPLD